MGLFSFFKKSKVMKCDWCKQEMEELGYVKHVGKTTYYFCSEKCKKNFREFNKGKMGGSGSCPTCRTCKICRL